MVPVAVSCPLDFHHRCVINGVGKKAIPKGRNRRQIKNMSAFFGLLSFVALGVAIVGLVKPWILQAADPWESAPLVRWGIPSSLYHRRVDPSSPTASAPVANTTSAPAQEVQAPAAQPSSTPSPEPVSRDSLTPVVKTMPKPQPAPAPQPTPQPVPVHSNSNSRSRPYTCAAANRS